jgi:predicted TIM-barrel fold metal-dependent hydrolase
VLWDDLILPWLGRLREQLPGLELTDAHTHIGHNDPDGLSCSPEQLIEALELAGARGVVFAMHEPDGYPPANDRVLEAAAASGGRLVPFARIDPRADPAREAERCLDAGARGLKLHPRAERFTLDHPGVWKAVAVAHERRLPVICHAGRGIPALGRHALELCARYPDARLILAHAGICDLAWIWRAAGEHPNLFFDTAWWAPSDLVALFALVPPGQVLFGSDAPYGTPALSATLTLRYALQVGLSEEQLRAVCGGQLERLLAGEAPLDLGAAPGSGSLPQDPLLDRVYTFLVTALGRLLAGAEAEEALGLAVLAAEVGDEAPEAAVCRSILALLEERRRLAAETASQVDGRPLRAPGIHLIVLAAALTRTPDVPLAPDPLPVDVAQRARGEGPG